MTYTMTPNVRDVAGKNAMRFAKSENYLLTLCTIENNYSYNILYNMNLTIVFMGHSTKFNLLVLRYNHNSSDKEYHVKKYRINFDTICLVSEYQNTTIIKN